MLLSRAVRTADGIIPNRRCFHNSVTSCKGVTRRGKRWLARIYYDEQTVRLGLFATVEDAALAYECAARWLLGDFALPHMNRFSEYHYASAEFCLQPDELALASSMVADASKVSAKG